MLDSSILTLHFPRARRCCKEECSSNQYEYTKNSLHFFLMNVFRDREQVDRIDMPTHSGTHLDAPLEFYMRGRSVSDIPLDRLLFPPIALVDLTRQVSQNSSYSLSVNDLEIWERDHGRMPAGCVLFVRTGWSQVRQCYLAPLCPCLCPLGINFKKNVAKLAYVKFCPFY